MKYTNITTIEDFIITGFPGLPPEYYGLVSVLLLLIFLAIVVGNAFILTVIIYEQTLHKPTYLIIFYLAMTDITFGTVTLPKILARYWWNNMKSSFGACFTQMYFVHSLGAFNSSVLMIMAVDRFVAIWLPFRYAVLITNKTVCVACSLCCIVTFIRMLGLVLHALSLPYCNQNIITQCYCDHLSITQLGCGENVAYVKFVVLVNSMFSLLGLGSRCFVYLAHTLGFNFSTDAHVIITLMYSLIPCAVNPLIYSFKTKDIKDVLMQRFKNRKISVVLKIDCKHNIKFFFLLHGQAVN